MDETYTIEQCKNIAKWSICGSSGVYAPYEAAAQVFGDEKRDTSGAMFAYLFRRFGYPIYGWDGYKSLVSYLLTTPDPDVLLWCKPTHGMQHSFGFGLSRALEQQSQREYFALPRRASWEKHATYARINTAIVAAMEELKRPVFVRDVLYNVLGYVPDEDSAALPEPIEPSPQAGYGLGKFDPAKEYGSK